MFTRLLKRVFSIIGFEIKRKPLDTKKAISCGKNTDINNLDIEYRGDVSQFNAQNISIGTDSTIAGRFVLEKEFSKIKVGNNTYLGGSLVICLCEVEIGSNVLISWNNTILDNNSHHTNKEMRLNDLTDLKNGQAINNPFAFKNWDGIKFGKVVIKDNCWIGFNTIILKGVTIGEGSIVAAGSVVTTDVPDNCVFAGNPARFVKSLA